MMGDRTPLFSVTANDCEFSYTRGSGKGGQKRNKTSTAVHCKHPASGAYAYSDKTRSQHDNKRDAFSKMSKTPEFKSWLKLEVSRRTGEDAIIQEKVEYELLHNTKIEVKHNGKWVEENDTAERG